GPEVHRGVHATLADGPDGGVDDREHGAAGAGCEVAPDRDCVRGLDGDRDGRDGGARDRAVPRTGDCGSAGLHRVDRGGDHRTAARGRRRGGRSVTRYGPAKGRAVRGTRGGPSCAVAVARGAPRGATTGQMEWLGSCWIGEIGPRREAVGPIPGSGREDVPKPRTVELRRRTGRAVPIVVLLLLLATPGRGAAQATLSQELVVAGANTLLGGLTSGIMSWVRGESFLEGLWGGALGGGVPYAG